MGMKQVAVAAATVAVTSFGMVPAGAEDAAVVGVSFAARHSLKCLNVAGGSTAEDAPVIQYGCGPFPNEWWVPTLFDGTTYQLRVVHSGKCLQVLGGRTDNNAPVVQHSCENTFNQLWQLEKDVAGFRLRNRNSNKCLDVFNMGVADEVQVVQWDCVLAHPSQDWIVH